MNKTRFRQSKELKPKIMRTIRYILIVLVAAVFLTGPAMPFLALYSDSPLKAIELARKSRDDDPPWDPGDECPSLRAVNPDGLVNIAGDNVLLARKGDQPWDPGDESGRHRRAEVGHA